MAVLHRCSDPDAGTPAALDDNRVSEALSPTWAGALLVVRGKDLK